MTEKETKDFKQLVDECSKVLSHILKMSIGQEKEKTFTVSFNDGQVFFIRRVK